MKKILIIVLVFILNMQLLAHPWKPDCYVIIETDCGLDDYRAINLMLHSNNIRVLGIIVSDGVVEAREGYVKLKSLLAKFGHDGLLIGVNTNSSQDPKDCIVAQEFHWGSNIENITEYKNYEEVLNRIFQHSKERISYVNLGGLNTLNSYFEKYPEKIERMNEILWTVNSELESSFNYMLDTSSYLSLKNKNIDLSLINGQSFGHYSNSLISEIKESDHISSSNIYKSIEYSKSPFAKTLFDESAIFYLLNKEIFILNNGVYSLKPDVNISNAYIELIQDQAVGKNQVLDIFTVDTSDYIVDIQKILRNTVDKYGYEEWQACVLTSELHRHLGVYSLIGAKMGIRAREFFGAGVDELKVISYAGLTPPFSCLNDGLQVSTGATLGHGLISVKEDMKLPKAEFYYLGQKATISLKEEYAQKIASEIKELNVIHGLDSNVYWDLVRDLAIKYWANWSRFEIFDIEVE